MIPTALLTLLTLGATTTTALPADLAPNPPPNPPTNTNATLIAARDSSHLECLNYSPAIDQSSALSPKWGDCLQLRANIDSGGGLWQFFSGPRQTVIASYESRAPSASRRPRAHVGGDLDKDVGNIDLIKIVEYTEAMLIAKGGEQVATDDKNGKKYVKWDAKVVGSKGTMECYQLVLRNNKFGVDWGLYHT